MTDAGLQMKGDETERRHVEITRFLFFVITIILLSFLCLFNRMIEVKRPQILLAATGFALFNFKRPSGLSLIQRIVLLYIVEMQFNQLSQQFIHLQAGHSNVTVSLGLIDLPPFYVPVSMRVLHSLSLPWV